MIGFINTFVYNLSNSQSIIALPLIYPFQQSLRDTIRFPATDLSQQLSFQITMKSSCHFLFDHLGMTTLQNSTKFSNVNSLIQSIYNRPSLHSRDTDHIENTFYWGCVFTVLLSNTGNGTDHTENTSSVVRIILLPSN
jgi:hypothetical protein